MRINDKDVAGLLYDLTKLTGEQYILRTSYGHYYISKRTGSANRDSFDGTIKECWAWTIGALTLARENLKVIQNQIRQEVQTNV